jgi:hypothetical protein
MISFILRFPFRAQRPIARHHGVSYTTWWRELRDIVAQVGRRRAVCWTVASSCVVMMGYSATPPARRGRRMSRIVVGALEQPRRRRVGLEGKVSKRRDRAYGAGKCWL